MITKQLINLFGKVKEDYCKGFETSEVTHFYDDMYVEPVKEETSQRASKRQIRSIWRGVK